MSPQFCQALRKAAGGGSPGDPKATRGPEAFSNVQTARSAQRARYGPGASAGGGRRPVGPDESARGDRAGARQTVKRFSSTPSGVRRTAVNGPPRPAPASIESVTAASTTPRWSGSKPRTMREKTP